MVGILHLAHLFTVALTGQHRQESRAVLVRLPVEFGQRFPHHVELRLAVTLELHGAPHGLHTKSLPERQGATKLIYYGAVERRTEVDFTVSGPCTRDNTL